MGTEKQPVPSFSLAAPDRGKASTLEKTAYLVSLSMKKIRSLLLAFGSLGCFLSSPVFAEHPYETAVLLEIQKKIATVPRSYLWDVVVTYSETETYELRIRMGNETYITDYTPIIQPSNPALRPSRRVEDRSADRGAPGKTENVSEDILR